MDEVTVVAPKGSNLTGGDWWALEEEDNLLDEGIFSGSFVPPPPRPIFLDESATPDGLTTCDLCSWAWQSSNTFTFETTLEAPGELSWFITLVIVSIVSAVVGAIVMIAVLHWRRLKNSTTESRRNPRNRPPISTPDDKAITTITPGTFPIIPSPGNTTFWSWISRKSNPSAQLENLPVPTSSIENHYTHMEDNYNSVGEALYAELDRNSEADDVGYERDNNSPAYQNSAYTDPDAPTSSAPSSAYYSDLSVSGAPDRAYEVVGLTTIFLCDHGFEGKKGRLAAISESSSVPSDYV